MQNYTLKPGEVLPANVSQQLAKINNDFSKSSDFAKYLSNLRQLFQIEPIQVTSEAKLYLAGFVEGEGSLNISAKKTRHARFGVVVDPEFSITQHVNGFKPVYLALEVFKTGRIRHKGGSNATMVLTIDNRKSLEEKVIPFYEQYVAGFSSSSKNNRVTKFKTLLDLFNKGSHKDKDLLINDILPIWDELRQQKGQKNQAFKDLNEAATYIRQK
uniref:Homing endonuclease LAGLIDADG domain-containing protein n=1 Tax=Chlorococcum echinozygotum TaxID=48000 RepID=Q8WKZ1_CHLEC|nr:putative protein [Chlorococcum echinozygotum]